MRSADHGVKEKFRLAFIVPAVSGNYAEQRITFGRVASTSAAEQWFLGVTALIEAAVANATLELWLPQVSTDAAPANAFTIANYYNSGKSLPVSGGLALTAAQGISETWALAGYPGAELRVKSGGTPGSMTVSASAF